MTIFKIKEPKSLHSTFRVNDKKCKFQNGMFATDDKDIINYLSSCGYADKIGNETKKETK